MSEFLQALWDLFGRIVLFFLCMVLVALALLGEGAGWLVETYGEDGTRRIIYASAGVLMAIIVLKRIAQASRRRAEREDMRHD